MKKYLQFRLHWRRHWNQARPILISTVKRRLFDCFSLFFFRGNQATKQVQTIALPFKANQGASRYQLYLQVHGISNNLWPFWPTFLSFFAFFYLIFTLNFMILLHLIHKIVHTHIRDCLMFNRTDQDNCSLQQLIASHTCVLQINIRGRSRLIDNKFSGKWVIAASIYLVSFDSAMLASLIWCGPVCPFNFVFLLSKVGSLLIFLVHARLILPWDVGRHAKEITKNDLTGKLPFIALKRLNFTLEQEYDENKYKLRWFWHVATLWSSYSSILNKPRTKNDKKDQTRTHVYLSVYWAKSLALAILPLPFTYLPPVHDIFMHFLINLIGFNSAKNQWVRSTHKLCNRYTTVVDK